MADPVTAIVGSTIGSTVGGIYSANKAAKASKGAANAQVAANREAMAFKERMSKQANALLERAKNSSMARLNPAYAKAIETHERGLAAVGGGSKRVMEILGRTGDPVYSKIGQSAFKRMADIAGVHGTDARSRALAGIEGSPELEMMKRRGEESLLRNASATGGLRGGMTQRALGELNHELLAKQIGTEFSRLGELADKGYQRDLDAARVILADDSAANRFYELIGAAHIDEANALSDIELQTAANKANVIADQGSTGVNLLQSTGQARAGGILGQGKAYADGTANVINSLGMGVGAYGGVKGWGGPSGWGGWGQYYGFPKGFSGGF